MSETATDVVRGHWQGKASCHQAVAKAETEKVAKPVAKVEMPIAQTDTTEETPIALEPIASRGDNPPLLPRLWRIYPTRSSKKMGSKLLSGPI